MQHLVERGGSLREEEAMSGAHPACVLCILAKSSSFRVLGLIRSSMAYICTPKQI
jgi:hypothetical protein